MSILIRPILAVIVFAVFLFITLKVYQKPPLAMAALFLLLVLQTLFSNQGALFLLGGRNFYPGDLIMVVFLIAGLSGLFGRGRIGQTVVVLLLCFLMVLLFEYANGVMTFGLRRATLLVRNYLYFISAVVLFASVSRPIATWRRFEKALTLFGAFLVVVVLVRSALVLSGLTWNPEWLSPGGNDLRVLPAAPTFLLLETVLILWQKEHRTRFEKYIIFASIPAILLLQQRTVWVAALLAFLFVLIRERRIRRKFSRAAIMGVILGGIVFSVFAGDKLVSSVGASAENTKSLDWRIEGWQALLESSRDHDIQEFIVGNPIGRGYSRVLVGEQTAVTVGPHDYYVQLFLDLGLSGVFLFLMLYVLLLSRYRSGEGGGGFYPRAIPSLLFVQLIYNITYGPDIFQGAILGMAISFYALGPVLATDTEERISGAHVGSLDDIP